MTERAFLATPDEAQGLHVGSITRIIRVVDPQPTYWQAGKTDDKLVSLYWWERDGTPARGMELSEFLPFSPFGVAGDQLWLAEVWGVASRPCPNRGWYDGIEYANEQAALQEHDVLPCHEVDVPDDVDLDELKGQWNSAASMPRWAASLVIDVKEVRLVRAQEITEEDAIGSGVKPHWEGEDTDCMCFGLDRPAACNFMMLRGDDWDSDSLLWIATVAKVAEVAA